MTLSMPRASYFIWFIVDALFRYIAFAFIISMRNIYAIVYITCLSPS